MTEIRVLEILLHGVTIGTLTLLPGDRTLFSFEESYISDENRPVLGLAFKDQFGELITNFRTVQTRVQPYFSNLLPEGRLRSYLAANVGVKEIREFFLLRALGCDLPGAVTVKPTGGEAWLPSVDDYGEISDSRHSNVLRFSLAGVQLKFSAIEAASGGLTIPAHGMGGSWIVKLPSLQYEGTPENEYSMMSIAKLIGMDVPEIRLIEPDMIVHLPEGIGTIRGKAFAIKRFDRLEDGTPIHTEDFAQVFNIYPENKYTKASVRNIANVITNEGSDVDIAEFIRRLTFNSLIGNADMHLKNWSLIYPNKRNAALAPAYDFVSTIPYISDDRAALTFSRSKRFDQFSEDELLHLAAKVRLPAKLVLDTAHETVELFHQYWKSEKTHLPLDNKIVRAIEEHLKTVPIAG